MKELFTGPKISYCQCEDRRLGGVLRRGNICLCTHQNVPEHVSNMLLWWYR